MAKIKHIALSTQDVDKTAKFYIDVFGMKEIAKIDSPGAATRRIPGCRPWRGWRRPCAGPGLRSRRW